MKLLLLSCSTGEGHNSAARALAEAAERAGAEPISEDPVSFGGERARRAVAGTYNGMIRRTPRLFGTVYRIGALYERTALTSPVYYANTLYARTLEAYLRHSGVNAVIATHLYGMEAMAAVRRRTGCTVPCCGVLTDYTRIPFFAEPQIERYFIPHEDLRQELLEKGVPTEKIIASGIPVSARFGVRTEKSAARAALGLPRAQTIYLIMTGGVGCAFAADLCALLTARIAPDSRVLVLTGRNDRLCRTLSTRFGSDPRVQALPFTTDVPLYMNAADVLLTKSGGLSATEAAVAGVPAVFVPAIPGCESKNAAFFAARGMAEAAQSLPDAAEKAAALAADPARAAQMIARQAQHTRADAADQIVREVMRLA